MQLEKVLESTSYDPNVDAKEIVDSSLAEIGEKDISWWFNPEDKKWNPTIVFNGKKSRLRSGILIIKGDSVLLSKEKGDEGNFSLAGGGLDKNESLLDAAVREAKEEVHINVKNARYTGCDYCEIHTEVMPWVKKHVPEKEWWLNYYTCLIIADYDSEYKGPVAKVDQDKTMLNNRKWYKISEVIDKPSFKPQWKKALIKFGYLKENLEEHLEKATPYMLRNDGSIFKCNNYHPYISNIYDNNIDNLDSLVNERLDELNWYFTHTNNPAAINYIQTIIKTACNNNINLLHQTEELYKKFNVEANTYACKDNKELYNFLDALNYTVNQEFCKVRTSDVKYGGNNNDIYFRISSQGFNWFDLIWNFIIQNKDYITTITISKDGRVRDFSLGDCYIVNGIKIDHLPINEFIELSGNPVIETFKSKLIAINEANKKLSTGSYLEEAYPNLHPRDLVGFYKYQINEQANWDLKHILQPKSLEEKLKIIGMPEAGPLFITPEGKYIKCPGNIHDSIFKTGDFKKEDYKDLTDFINKNNFVRINDGGIINTEWYLELPEKPITEAQYDCILIYLDYMLTRRCKQVTIAIIGHKYQTYNIDESSVNAVSPDEIVKKIRNAYTSNTDLKEEYIDEEKQMYTTTSVYEVVKLIKQENSYSLRILWDKKLKRYFICNVDDFIHRDMAEKALEQGYYGEMQRWELSEYLDTSDVVYFIYAPTDLVEHTYGCSISEDGYDEQYQYEFGVLAIRTSDDYEDLARLPLVKALGPAQKHLRFDGWIDNYTPKVIQVESLKEDLKDDAKKYFGITNDPKLGFYINTDGTILDGSGKAIGGAGTSRTIDHREISDIFGVDGIEGTEAMTKYMNEGNIRYMPECNGFDIIKEPTNIQYKVIQAIIDKLVRLNYDSYLVVSNDKGNVLYHCEYDDPSKLIPDLKEYFKNNNVTNRWIVEKIVKLGSKYQVQSEKGRNMGTYDTKAEAKKRLQQIEYFKHKNEGIEEKVFYHGTYEPRIIKKFNKIVSWFTTDYDYAKSFGDSIYACKLSVKKAFPAGNTDGRIYKLTSIVPPYEFTNEFNTLINVADINEINVREELDRLAIENDYERDGYKMPIFTFVRSRFFAEALKKRGYDSILSLEFGHTCIGVLNPDLVKIHKIFKVKNMLNEDTRTQQINNSKNVGDYKLDQSRGKNRYERKRYSTISSSTKGFNNIDMNDFFKKDILEVKVPVQGETDNYTVTIKMEGVVNEIARNIKSNHYKFEYKNILQALTKIYNTTDIYTKCTCQDFCLAPDTMIKLLNGTIITVEELETKFKNSSKPLYLYSVDNKGDFKPGKIKNVWVSSWTDEMIKITLDNGKYVITTADHPYLLRNGQYSPAYELKVGQSLMPLYFSSTKNGYETVKANSKATTEFYSTYKQVANAVLQKEIADAKIRSGEDHIAIHHKDFNKNNNDPDNLYPMGVQEHYKYHYEHVKDSGALEKFRAAGEKYRKLVMDHSTPEYRKQAEIASKNAKKYWDSLTDKERELRAQAKSEMVKKAWESGKFDTDKFHQARQQNVKKLHTPEIKAKAINGIHDYWASLTPEEKKDRVAKNTGLIAGQGWNKGKHLTDEDRLHKSQAALNRTPEEKAEHNRKIRDSKMLVIFNKMLEDKVELTAENYENYRKNYFHYAPPLKTYFKNINDAITYFKLNHKIVSIERIKYENLQPVYDIEVEDYHNFYVDAGIILHNCYNFAHWNIINNVSVDDTSKDPGVGRNIRNPKDDKGRGCKHILLVLDNTNWLMKVANVLDNYIKYAETNMKAAFDNLIFTKLYDMDIDDAQREGLIPEDIDIKTEKHIIEVINDNRTRGKTLKKPSKEEEESSLE